MACRMKGEVVIGPGCLCKIFLILPFIKSNSLSHLAAPVEAYDITGIHITTIISTSINRFMLVKYNLFPSKYLPFHEDTFYRYHLLFFLDFLVIPQTYWHVVIHLSLWENFAVILKSVVFSSRKNDCSPSVLPLGFGKLLDSMTMGVYVYVFPSPKSQKITQKPVTALEAFGMCLPYENSKHKLMIL